MPAAFSAAGGGAALTRLSVGAAQADPESVLVSSSQSTVCLVHCAPPPFSGPSLASSISRARLIVPQAQHDPSAMLARARSAASSAKTAETYLAALRRHADCLNRLPVPRENGGLGVASINAGALRQAAADLVREAGIFVDGEHIPLGSRAALASLAAKLWRDLSGAGCSPAAVDAALRRLLVASSRTVNGGDTLKLVQDALSSAPGIAFIAAEAGGPVELSVARESGDEGAGEGAGASAPRSVSLTAVNCFRVVLASDVDSEAPASSGGVAALVRCALSERVEGAGADGHLERAECAGNRDEAGDTPEALLERLLVPPPSTLPCENLRFDAARTLNIDIVFL